MNAAPAPPKIEWPTAATDAELIEYVTACRRFVESVTPETLVGNLAGHLALHASIVRPALARVVQPGAQVLDFGCGVGRLSELLVRMRCRVVGADLSRPAIVRASQIVPEGVFVVLPGTGELPFPPETFDAVVTMITLQHIQFFPVRHRYLFELHRVLRPGGRFLAQLNSDDSGAHIRWFERGESGRYFGAPDVVCNEAEIETHLETLGFGVDTTWRTAADTTTISWNQHAVGKTGAWLWVLATKSVRQ